MTEVDRSLTPVLTKVSFVSTNDDWSVNKNSKVDLKMYEVEFEIWLGDLRNALSEYRMQSFYLVKGRVLVQASKPIKSSSV